jgi:2-keto-4-pentenoate hydratase/2-oxohepta-3-ene-1,7-dioic acid hydratase in catechol pathway
MQYLRFIDDADQLRFGCNPSDDFKDAELLSDSPLAGGKPTGHRIEIAKLLCPIEPTAILCIGLNYRKHAEETGAELPKWPVLFMKNLAAANHPGQPIVLPKCSVGPEVDYECELGVVIGKAARDVKPAEVLEHVLGYTVGNDVSARRWQKHSGGGQWVRGKSFDTFCPFGPVIVDTDEIPDPQTLDVSTTLNGETMQQSNTADMIFSVADLIAELSKDLTLLPGTLLLTGTPSGVGVARKPPVYLKAGDAVTCTISGIGALTNPVVDA